MGSKVKTDFLVSSPSRLSGAARLFDLYGQFDRYNESGDEDEADDKAIRADWSAVGDEIGEAIEVFELSQTA